ncbi:hypothetical protein DCAR_0626370 [Daucus carota subsp. sativus]|uniref:Uncharacterized protein n=1 Tax=Daucus carota subsp. sativus TaxID=79200 RepID=A0AAF0XET6_DAUCS|nr:hypothetical protein DCAR_0626370 [Daucus carota subsp. sativus]
MTMRSSCLVLVLMILLTNAQFSVVECRAFPSNVAEEGAATGAAMLVVSPRNSGGGVSSAVQSLMFKLASGPSKRGRGH